MTVVSEVFRGIRGVLGYGVFNVGATCRGGDVCGSIIILFCWEVLFMRGATWTSEAGGGIISGDVILRRFFMEGGRWTGAEV